MPSPKGVEGGKYEGECKNEGIAQSSPTTTKKGEQLKKKEGGRSGNRLPQQLAQPIIKWLQQAFQSWLGADAISSLAGWVREDGSQRLLILVSADRQSAERDLGGGGGLLGGPRRRALHPWLTALWRWRRESATVGGGGEEASLTVGLGRTRDPD